jgi:hypothetical protein
VSQVSNEGPRAPSEVTWYSPLHPAIAIRYERRDNESAWRITGLIVSSRTDGLGSSWMKAFPWRRFGSPYLADVGIFWHGTPTIDVLDEVYDETGHLKKQTADVYKPMYRTQIEPVTEAHELFRSRTGDARFDQTIEWGELHTRLQAEGAGPEAIELARKDLFFRRVADVYKTASRSTGKPVEAVADAFNAPRTSAANWIREARARGYLPPTTKGRAT